MGPVSCKHATIAPLNEFTPQMGLCLRKHLSNGMAGALSGAQPRCHSILGWRPMQASVNQPQTELTKVFVSALILYVNRADYFT